MKKSSIPIGDSYYAITALDGPAVDALKRVQQFSGQAAARAINRARTAGRTVIIRAVAEELDVQGAKIRPYVLKGRLATKLIPTATIEVSNSGRVPLIEFGTRSKPIDTRKAKFDPLGRGVTVKIRRREPRERFPKAFIERIGGELAILQRNSDWWRERHHLVRLRGPTVLAVVKNNPKTRDAVRDRIQEILLKRLHSQLDLLLRAEGVRLPGDTEPAENA